MLLVFNDGPLITLNMESSNRMENPVREVSGHHSMGQAGASRNHCRGNRAFSGHRPAQEAIPESIPETVQETIQESRYTGEIAALRSQSGCCNTNRAR
jgi:hypothetical protein